MRTPILTALLALALTTISVAQSANAPRNEISAGQGNCSATLNVTTTDGKPVYGAKVQTQIQYGLLGVKKLDLEAWTDANGHLTITQLPLTLKKPLYIHIQKDGKEQIVEFHPEKSCEAKFDVVMY